MKSSKAELEKTLRALAGTGPVGLAKLESATGRNLRTLQRWGKQDPAFRQLLAPLLLRDRGGHAPATVADDGVRHPLDARLVERLAIEAEGRRQAEIQKGLSDQDLLAALRKLKDSNLLIDHLRSENDHLRSRIAELETGQGEPSSRDAPETPLTVIRGGRK